MITIFILLSIKSRLKFCFGYYVFNSGYKAFVLAEAWKDGYLKHVKSQSCLFPSLLHHLSFVGIIQSVMRCLYIR